MRDLKCPDCGEDVTNSPCEDFHEEGDHETECGNCGTPVIVTAYVSVDYTVRLVEPKETTHAQE